MDIYIKAIVTVLDKERSKVFLRYRTFGLDEDYDRMLYIDLIIEYVIEDEDD